MTEKGEAISAVNNWMIIRTRPRWEKKVSQLIGEKGIEAFCPVYKSRRRWSDRMKVVDEPLLKSYVFVKVADDQRTIVRVTQGVVNFVNKNGKAVIVKEKLIQNIQDFLQRFPYIEVFEETNKGEADNSHSTNGELTKKPDKLFIPKLNFTLLGFHEPKINAEADKL